MLWYSKCPQEREGISYLLMTSKQGELKFFDPDKSRYDLKVQKLNNQLARIHQIAIFIPRSFLLLIDNRILDENK